MAHGQISTPIRGDRVRALREQSGYNLRQLAQVITAGGLPISHSQLSKVERGVCRPRPALLAAMARALHVPAAELTEDTPDIGGNVAPNREQRRKAREAA